MINYATPREIAAGMVDFGRKKAALTIGQMILRGMLAGAFIAFAAHFATTVATGWGVNGEEAFFGLKKFMVGAVFSVGLMMVILLGTELFTGNCLMPPALLDGKITFRSMFRNWFFVWWSNFAGALLFAFLVAGLGGLLNGEVGRTAVKIAEAKCSLTNIQILARGILANWVVCLAILMSMAAKDVSGKILAVFFPIAGFVASGFEHSIANMYFIPAGLIARGGIAGGYPDLNVLDGVRNILLSTVGNIIGGSLLVAMPLHLTYCRSGKEPS